MNGIENCKSSSLVIIDRTLEECANHTPYCSQVFTAIELFRAFDFVADADAEESSAAQLPKSQREGAMSRRQGVWDALFGPKDKFSVQHMNHLFNTLVRHSTVTEGNRELIIETVREMAELITWGDQNNQSMIDFFLEKNVLQYFLKILHQKTHKTVKVQVIQTLSILVQNLSNEEAVNYILSNNHINEMINHRFDFSDEELMAYYISFLKTLSFRLNPGTIHLFFNDREFPLYTEAISFFNHDEHMVRVAVRTLTLNIYKVDDARLRKFIVDKTAVPYFSNLMWFVRDKYLSMSMMVAETRHTDTSRLDQLASEQLDVVYYLNDVFNVDVPQLSAILSGRIIHHLFKPLVLEWLVAPPNSKRANQNHGPAKECLALTILSQFFSVFQNTSFVDALARILVGRNATSIDELAGPLSPKVRRSERKGGRERPSLLRQLDRQRGNNRQRMGAGDGMDDKEEEKGGGEDGAGGAGGSDKASSGTRRGSTGGDDDTASIASDATTNTSASTKSKSKSKSKSSHQPSSPSSGSGSASKSRKDDSVSPRQGEETPNAYRNELLALLATGDDHIAFCALLLFLSVIGNSSISQAVKDRAGLLPQRFRKTRMLLDELTTHNSPTSTPTKSLGPPPKASVAIASGGADLSLSMSCGTPGAESDGASGNVCASVGSDDDGGGVPGVRRKLAVDIAEDGAAPSTPFPAPTSEPTSTTSIPCGGGSSDSIHSVSSVVDTSLAAASPLTSEHVTDEAFEKLLEEAAAGADADASMVTHADTEGQAAGSAPHSSTDDGAGGGGGGSGGSGAGGAGAGGDDSFTSAPPQRRPSSTAMPDIQVEQPSSSCAGPARTENIQFDSFEPDNNVDMIDGYSLGISEAILSLLTRCVPGDSKFRPAVTMLAARMLSELASQAPTEVPLPCVSDGHFRRLLAIYDVVVAQVREFLIGSYADLFVDVFDEEAAALSRRPLTVDRLCSDTVILLPAASDPIDSISISLRLACTEVERMRSAVMKFLELHRMMRALSCNRDRSPFNVQLPHVAKVKPGDVIENIEEYDVIACNVQGSTDRKPGDASSGRRLPLKRYFMLESTWFALVEPDHERINVAIIRTPIPLQRIEEVRVWSRDARSLQIVVSASVPKMRWGPGGVRLGLGPCGVTFPGTTGTTDQTLHLTFDDEASCLSARERLVEARERLLGERKAVVAELLDIEFES